MTRATRFKVGDLIMIFYKEDVVACCITTTSGPEKQDLHSKGLVLWSQFPPIVLGTKEDILCMDKTVLSPEEWLL